MQILFPLILIVLVGCLILVLVKFVNLKNRIREKDLELHRKLYELAISQNISREIGYSFNTKNIIETLVESIGKAVSNSAIAYALVDNATITLKIFENDYLDRGFLETFKKKTLEEFYKSLPDKNYQVIDSVQKDYVSSAATYVENKAEDVMVVPIEITGNCVGVLSIASAKKGGFSNAEQSFVRQTVENTAQTIGKIDQVINTEKGKLDSFLFSLSSGAVQFLLDGETLKISAINSAAKQFLHVEDRSDTVSIIAHFGMHHDLVKDIREVAEQKKSTMIKNVKIYDKYFKLYLNPVFLHSSNQVIGVSLTMEDVTLERDVEQLLETFTSMVVHELRAPLASIKGASSMLLSDKLNKEDKDKMLHIIYNSTDKMLNDIGDILDVNKLEVGKFTLNKTVSNINDLVKEKVLTFSFTAQERHIKIESSLDEGITQSLFDAQRIGQVLNNLLSNALKFTPDNGVITATTSRQDGQILVSIHDTGVGVPEEKKSLLFSKYGQLSSSITREGGTGLGLYISKGIIESHGGKIWLDGKPGEGTTVSFTLPIVTKVEDAEISSPTVAKPQIPSSTISQRVVN